MRKLSLVITAFLLIFCLSFSAFAANDVERAGLIATVAEDGSCQVTLTISLRMEQTDRTMRYPVPGNAQNVLLNGSPVGTYYANGVQQVDLSGVILADAQQVTFTLQYTVTTVVSGSQVQLPLLSGFQLPVNYLDFTVKLPGDIQGKPAFSSTYHQSDIEKDLSWNYAGDTITGRSLNQIKDYESLYLYVPVSNGMFSVDTVGLFSTDVHKIGMWICGILAVVYWLFFLRVFPPKLRRSTQPPQGHTAGSLGSVLTLDGTDLSLMILSWAQMGYVVLEARRDHKVLIHYAMGMGNERSEFEQRTFNKLFNRRSVIDTGSLQYASLCKTVAAQAGPARSLIHKRSGNMLILRILTALFGLFAGMFAGLCLPLTGFLQVFLAITYSAAGFLCAWGIQNGTQGLILWRPYRLKTGIAAFVLWLALCTVANVLVFGIFTALIFLFFGLLGTYGGRRTEEGKRTLEQVLGLRKHLRTLDRDAVSHIQAQDPEYFHNMLPYALALGADTLFARRFNKEKLPDCPYIVGITGGRTAMEYSTLFRQIHESMNARYRQLSREQIGKAVQSVKR